MSACDQSQIQKARKYWQDSIKKYRQRVINQGRLKYRVAFPSMLDGPVKLDREYTKTCYWIEITHNDPCAYCGGPADNTDHVVPISEIGMKANRWDNLTACCTQCNRAKWTKPLLQYLWEVNQ